MNAPAQIVLAVATLEDREAIFRLRHEVYARELGQHAVNERGVLSDELDGDGAAIVYLVARRGDELAGVVGITLPTSPRYSIDKYLERSQLPFAFDAGLFEIRLLTVVAARRSGPLAMTLMYGALRWVEAHGGTAIEALGRSDLVGLYRKCGLDSTGIEVRSGRVSFSVMHAPVAAVRAAADGLRNLAGRIERTVAWRLPIPQRPPAACFHGGAFFDAVGPEFETLERRHEVINADVLDAWFPPSPKALAAIEEHLEWLLRTSPPTGCEGLIRTIAECRGICEKCVLPGGGSSDLIYLALRRWLRPGDSVLLLDPSYGEYQHLLERVIGCRVERLTLDRAHGWRVEPERLAACLARAYDLVVLVNPNSPTGVHMRGTALADLLRAAPVSTRIWIDETYVDFAGSGESLERFAAASANVVVCKSMSKAYALSGVRCAYLCASARTVADLRALTPPWTVGLVGQVAAVEALRDAPYYDARWRETARLRETLARGLVAAVDAEVVPGVANFLLFHLPRGGPSPEQLAGRCRERGLFLRTFHDMDALASDALRIAVKDEETNARMLTLLRAAAS